MGKKAKWLSSVRKAFSPDSKEKKEQKSKQKLLATQNDQNSNQALTETLVSPPQPLPEEGKTAEKIVELNKDACSSSTSPNSDVPAVSAQPVLKVVQCANKGARFAGKSKEEVAAIRIQTAFRGYLARRARRGLRCFARLRLLMEGPSVKRQVANSLKCMQSLSRVQTQIRARRIRMSEENQARQRQLLQKHAKELSSFRGGEEWNESTQSKEQVEANLLCKFEAAMRRERALAYAYSHQQTLKNSSKFANSMFMDLSNITWGWSWLERWMAGRPSEVTDKKEPNSNDKSSVKNANRTNPEGQITKSFINHKLNSSQPSSPSARTPRKNTNTLFQSPSTHSKPKNSKPTRSSVVNLDEDAKSVISATSDVNRRHSIAGTRVMDDAESLGSSPSLPSYMVPTASARSRLKSSSQSPLGVVGSEENGVPEKGPVKKRLIYPASKPRRFSAPPKVESSVPTKIAVTTGG